MGSGYTPLGVALIPAALSDWLSELVGFNFSHTYNTNAIYLCGRLAILEQYARLDLVDAAAR